MITFGIWFYILIFVAIGMSRKLLRSAFTLWTVALSGYVAVWSCKWLDGVVTFLPSSVAPWRSVIFIGVVFMLMMLILQLTVRKIMPEEALKADIPATLNIIGGMFCSGATGYITAYLLLICCFASPLPGMSGGILDGAMSEMAQKGFMRFSTTVNKLSRQSSYEAGQREFLATLCVPDEETEEADGEDSDDPPSPDGESGSGKTVKGAAATPSADTVSATAAPAAPVAPEAGTMKKQEKRSAAPAGNPGIVGRARNRINKISDSHNKVIEKTANEKN